MRAAVITDIHSNLPALQAVLAAIDEREVDEIWCLGDVVGYGASPDACANLVRERCDICLVGNHDLAVLGDLDISSFSSAAADAVRWTQKNASKETLDLMRDLEPSGSREGFGLFHASPRDPIWEYVLSTDQADDCMDVQPEPVCLIGHSHVALYFLRAERGTARGAQAPLGSMLDLDHGTWLLNPGSAGQPRDGDPRAAWLELDSTKRTARFQRVSYDIDEAATAIVDAGLPKHLAQRLYGGQ